MIYSLYAAKLYEIDNEKMSYEIHDLKRRLISPQNHLNELSPYFQQ